jgi:hypothetical protein
MEVLSRPVRLDRLDASSVDLVLRFLARANLLASVGRRLESSGELKTLAPAVRDRFEAAFRISDEHQRRLRWGVHLVRRALLGFNGRLALLKGGAYSLAELPNAPGRLVSDLDILVAEADLERVEQMLLEAGFQPQKSEDYDQSYYREWMHELPPLWHPIHAISVDVHHNISPRTSRLQIDAKRLLDDAIPVQAGDRFLRFSDPDLILHLCIHLFHDDEMDNSLRELYDLATLLRVFAETPGFWARLLERADRIGVSRLLFYGVEFTTRWFGVDVPASVVDRLSRAAPAWPVRSILHWAMSRALVPELGDRPSRVRSLAVFLLFLRSHWLRMPLGLLIRHLITQAWRRGGLKTGEQAAGNA